jgi:hypothetical protein
MASTYLYVGGVQTNSKNVWKIEDTGSALSVVESYLVGGASDNATNIVQDLDGNIYVYVTQQERIYKYDSTFTLDTSWGTSGYFATSRDIAGMAVDTVGYLAYCDVTVGGVDVVLLDETGTKVWEGAAPMQVEQICFSGAGDVYVGGGVSSGHAMAIQVGRAAPYAVDVTYAGPSGACGGTGAKVFGNGFVVAVRNLTSDNNAVLRIYENDNTLFYNPGSVNTLGNSQNVYIPRSSFHHTDPFYLVGDNSGTKSLYRLQYSDVTETVSILQSYDANNTIVGGNQVDFDADNNLYLASTAVTDEDSNLAKLRKLTSTLTLSYFTNDAALGNLFTVSSGASTPMLPQAPVEAYKTYSRKLVAIGGNEVWFMSTDNDETELTAANGDIDVTVPLDAFELDEKVFIVNKTNLKVADFGNTMIETDDIKDVAAGATSYPLRRVVVTGAGGAQMAIDYIDAIDGAAKIYGKKLNTTAFVDGELVSGTNSDATVVRFDIKGGTTETAPTPQPHWYDWTPYGNSSTYGTMPAEATMGCNWNGRAVISGNSYYPHLWYMFEQGNPWNLNWVSLDAQSPVVGNDADAGETGDLLVTLMPYKDDFLIHGCANSLWYNVGDPAQGGRLLELSLTAGILARNAFCWDKNDNLYILATTGILKIPKGFGPPENVTENSYPNFIKDLAFNSGYHTISMGYDPQRHGIKIYRTTLLSGANTGWWFDLRKNGLFPESVPNAAAPYCMFHNNAINPSYTGLLSGCTDGYIRVEDDDATDDDAGDDGDTAIDSYVTFGPLKLGKESSEGVLKSIAAITTGGLSTGSLTNSSALNLSAWVGLSSDEIVEKLDANASPNLAGTIIAPGRRRGGTIRRPVRGAYAGIRLGNDTASQTWGLEHLILDGGSAGRI